MVCIFDPACELLPPLDEGTILVYSIVAPLLYLLADLLPPPPFPMYSIYWQCVTVGVLKCTVDHILQEFYTLFLTRFRTYKIASPPQTKMTSKDDIKGLVSLKLLRPWSSVTVLGCSVWYWWCASLRAQVSKIIIYGSQLSSYPPQGSPTLPALLNEKV